MPMLCCNEGDILVEGRFAGRKAPAKKRAPSEPKALVVFADARRSGRLQGKDVPNYNELLLSRGPDTSPHAKQQRIIVFDGKEIYDEEHIAKLGTCETVWQKLDTYNKDSQVKCQVTGVTCHQCRQKTVDPKTRCQFCEGVTGQFCGWCLQWRYGENLDEVINDPQWHCPPCRGICNCSFCREAKGLPPTGQMWNKAKRAGYPSVAHYLIHERQRAKVEAEEEALQKKRKVMAGEELLQLGWVDKASVDEEQEEEEEDLAGSQTSMATVGGKDVSKAIVAILKAKAIPLNDNAKVESSPISEKTATNVENAAGVGAQKRGRGRPSKGSKPSSTKERKHESDGESDNEKEEMEVEAAKEVPKAKKRGRKSEADLGGGLSEESSEKDVKAKRRKSAKTLSEKKRRASSKLGKEEEERDDESGDDSFDDKGEVGMTTTTTRRKSLSKTKTAVAEKKGSSKSWREEEVVKSTSGSAKKIKESSKEDGNAPRKSAGRGKDNEGKKKKNVSHVEPGYDVDDPTIFQVEVILDERKTERGTEFLVKWLGYNEQSWEPEGNILCPSIVKEFRNGLKSNLSNKNKKRK